MSSGEPKKDATQRRELRLRSWTFRAIARCFVSEEKHARARKNRDIGLWIGGIAAIIGLTRLVEGAAEWKWPVVIVLLCAWIVVHNWSLMTKYLWFAYRASQVVAGSDPHELANVASAWKGWLTLEAEGNEFFQEGDCLDSGDVKISEIMNPVFLQYLEHYVQNEPAQMSDSPDLSSHE